MLSFQQFITEGKHKGWSAQEAAERLLNALKKESPAAPVFGVCEISHYRVEERPYNPFIENRLHSLRCWLSDDDRHEFEPFSLWPTHPREPKRKKLSSERRAALEQAFRRLEKKIEPIGPDDWVIVRKDIESTRVPRDAWNGLASVTNDLISQFDDEYEDEISTWTKVDWVSGIVEIHDNYHFIGTPWEIDDSHVASASVKYANLQISESLAERVLSYDDEELRNMVLCWPKRNGSVFWEDHKDDLRLGGRSQDDIRALWRECRNPEGKRGAPRKIR